jgi:hypothetical protein
MNTRSLVYLAGMLLLGGCATEKAAGPQAKTFEVPLTKSCDSAGAEAKGSATVTVAPDDASVTVTVNYSGLSGDVTAAHVHLGAAGTNGPVVLPFAAPFTSPFTKTFTAVDYNAAAGAPPDFAAFVTALKAGGAFYVNVHTAACKPGEIRGEIQ